MQFEKDIFISYAHMDDESLIADMPGWVSEFHRVLEIRLGQLMGAKPLIWRDPELHGNHIFDKEIVDQFSKVAIMISIVTPRYVKSDWCLKEVNEFRDICQQNIGFVVNNNARVFKVIKTPIPQDLHPDGIKNLLGYEFFATDVNTKRPKEFSAVAGEAGKGYWDKLDVLANDISVFLQGLKAVTSQSAPASAQQSDKKVKNIFLSESSYDTKDIRDSLKKELQDNGYNILPYGQLSLVAPVLKENVSQSMTESQLSIHLIGNNYGIIPEGAEKSIVEIQNEIGASKSVSDSLQRLIWIPENMDPSDERQKNFLNKLESGNKEVIAGADDLFKGSIEDFKSVVLDKLKAMEKSRQVAIAKVEENDEPTRKMVYLICDIQDLDIITDLDDFLFNNGVEVRLPLFEGDEALIRADHVENLKNCDGVIVFYGNGSEAWQRIKMREFQKLSVYERTKPLSFKGVYLASPASPTKQRFRTHEAEVINGIEQLPETELKNILSKL